MPRAAKKKSPPVLSKPRKETRSRERVLVEFPVSLLTRADEAAREMQKNRSDLIRTAVERLLEAREKEKLEADLAAAYEANAQMYSDLAEDFKYIDREGF